MLAKVALSTFALAAAAGVYAQDNVPAQISYVHSQQPFSVNYVHSVYRLAYTCSLSLSL